MNTAGVGYAWAVTIPPPRGGPPMDVPGKSPPWCARAWDDDSWQVYIPPTPILADRFYPVCIIAGPPVDRVTVWVTSIPRDGPLPALEISLRGGIGTSDVGTPEHLLAKGLGSVLTNRLFMQGTGVRYPEWALWARTTGGFARTIDLAFGITGTQSKCGTKGLVG